MTDFHLALSKDGYAAYAAPEAGTSAWPYLLVAAPNATPDMLSLAQAWTRTDAWALIVRDSAWPFDDESPATAAHTLGLAQSPQGSVVLAWRSTASPSYQTLPVGTAGDDRQTTTKTVLALANVQLTVPGGAVVSLSGDGDALHITRSSQFALTRSDVRMQSLTFDGVDLRTQSNGIGVAGSLCGAASSWRPRTLFLLGQDANAIIADSVPLPEIRYWQGGATNQRIRLPLFDPVDITAAPLAVDFALHLALPFDPAATQFQLKSGQALFAAPAGLTTPKGEALALAPKAGIGFHFARAAASPTSGTVYLAPFGRFTLAAPAGSSGAFRMMPGLSGIEYLEAQAGDMIELVPGMPAYGELADGAGATPRLADLATTSWLRLVPAEGRTSAYHAQPLSSVFYASSDGTSFPRAADAKVADLTGAEPPFPLAPYGRVFDPSVQAPASPAQIAAFEHTYLAGTRGQILGGSTPPIFSVDGKILTQTGATPRGLLADIGPAPATQTALAPGAAAAAEANTPPGQWRRLYLAQGDTHGVTVEPDAQGQIDPAFANALLQPDLFLVYNNWNGHPIGLTGELDVGGFSFLWTPLQSSDRTMVLVAKFSRTISLEDLFAMPERWRDPDTFVDDARTAQEVFNAAMDAARSDKTPGLFDDFLNRIATDPAWTGFVLFQAPIDGNAMPPTLQILLAGIPTTLRAHHVVIDVTALASDKGLPTGLGASAVAGVIAYDRPPPPEPPPPPPEPQPPADFGFFTQSLKVGILNAAITQFHAEVALAVPRLFGRAVALVPLAEDPAIDTFLLRGVYHVIANVPTVTFQLEQSRVFGFVTTPSVAGGRLARVLDRFEIDSASILPQTVPSRDAAPQTAQVTLNGRLWFADDPFGNGVDLFSYGTDAAGLPLANFGLAMTFKLNNDGTKSPALVEDYSRLAVTGDDKALRPAGLIGGLPFKLKGILADPAGIDLRKLGGKPVQLLQLATDQIRKPQFALQFDLVIGSLGELSGVHAALTAEMRLGWGPLETTPDADGVLLTIQLPGASGGFDGLNVQGMLQLVFGDANMMRVFYRPGQGTPVPVYALLFNNVALSVLGIKLPPKVVSDLILFSDPSNATASNLAACLAVRQQ